MSAAAAVRASGYAAGGFLVVLGATRVHIAPTPGGVVAGALMLLAGLVLVPQGRSSLEAVVGPMSNNEAAGLFLIALLGSFVLNVLAP